MNNLLGINTTFSRSRNSKWAKAARLSWAGSEDTISKTEVLKILLEEKLTESEGHRKIIETC